jgi:hypothetical protein
LAIGSSRRAAGNVVIMLVEIDGLGKVTPEDCCQIVWNPDEQRAATIPTDYL